MRLCIAVLLVESCCLERHTEECTDLECKLHGKSRVLKPTSPELR
jgi:hypothetical protein